MGVLKQRHRVNLWRVEPLKNVAAGSQTLLRGLDIIEAVSSGPKSLAALSQQLDLTSSTTHRLAASLVERGYLSAIPRGGYRLGPKLLDLGSRAQRQLDIVQIARPHLEALSLRTGDTVHLGVLAGDRALYLDKIAGNRRIEISSRIGERQPLTTTGLGKALLLDERDARWRERFAAERPGTDADPWIERMTAYATRGYAFDLEENEDRIRCVAAPLRGAGGGVSGAISVTSAAQYMDDARMAALAEDVRETAAAISAGLGWAPDEHTSIGSHL